MKVERSVELRALLAPVLDPRQRLVLRGRPLHRLQHVGARVLEGDVEIGQDLALGHQADDLVDMRVGVDILQPDPGAELAELLGEVEEFGADLAVLPRALGIFQVDAIGRGVLRDDQQFLDAGLDQPLGLAQHVIGRPRHQIAAQFRDDAEAAAVVAAFGNLQIGVVARRQLDALRRHQIEMRIVRRRQRAMHGIQHALILLRPGDREHAGIGRRDLLGFGAHAAGDDDLAVLGHGLADRARAIPAWRCRGSRRC